MQQDALADFFVVAVYLANKRCRMLEVRWIKWVRRIVRPLLMTSVVQTLI